MKMNKKTVIIIAVVIAALYLFNLFMNYYGDWLWFSNLNYGPVFNTMIMARVLSFSLFFLVFVLFLSVHLLIARKRGAITC